MSKDFPIIPPPINLAHSIRQTRSLGPGLRAVVWVQGCPLHCQGCISPAWTEARVARLVSPKELADELLEGNPLVEGLTISGGEPFAQPTALASLIKHCKVLRPTITVLCYSGYRLEHLKHLPGAIELLKQIDTLIDGPYLQSLNENRGLRGSSNQRIIHMTPRLAGYDFEHLPRQAEVYLEDTELTLVGIPPLGLLNALDRVSGGIL